MSELSFEDFNRLQVQLLDLREANCSLKEVQLKQKKELIDNQTKLRSLEDENIRLSNVVKLSKKAGDVELLKRDNEYLKARLRDQEDDFRLQNNTLLQELSKLVKDNESLEQQVTALCQNEASEHSCTDDVKNLMGLRGELSVVEKRLKNNESKWTSEVKCLKERISYLSNSNSQLINVLKLHSIPFDEGEIDVTQEAVSFKKLSLSEDSNSNSDDEKRDNSNIELKDQISKLEELLQTEKHRMEFFQNEICNLKSINATLEKEKLDQDLKNTTLEENVRLKDDSIKSLQIELAEIDNYKIQINDLQSDLTVANNRIKELEESISTYKHTIEELESSISTLNNQLENLNEELTKKTTEIESLEVQIKNLTETSDSRKTVIEEMKCHIELEEKSHQEKIDELQSQQLEELGVLRQQIEQLQEEKLLYEKFKEDHQNCAKEIKDQSLLNEQFRLNIVCLEEKITNISSEYKDHIAKLEKENLAILQEKEDSHLGKTQNLQTQIELSHIQNQELEDKIEYLNKQVTDVEEERKIHERKGLVMMKDLKKQLSSERKRADRLQEKLSQLLADPMQLSNLTTISEKSDDVSSVSSWSMLSGEPREANTSDQSIVIVNSANTSENITDETAALVSRVTELQQEKWRLEERISHLESSSAAMADDLLKKSALIQHYFIDATQLPSNLPLQAQVQQTNVVDKLGMRKMIDAIQNVGKGEESLKEMNRRLQCLLEETLSKNMHLHTDVDNLTKQVHHLSKVAANHTKESTIQSDDIGVDATDGLMN